MVSVQSEYPLDAELLQKSDNALQFWTVADEQRFSLAFLAVELLELALNY